MTDQINDKNENRTVWDQPLDDDSGSGSGGGTGSGGSTGSGGGSGSGGGHGSGSGGDSGTGGGSAGDSGTGGSGGGSGSGGGTGGGTGSGSGSGSGTGSGSGSGSGGGTGSGSGSGSFCGSAGSRGEINGDSGNNTLVGTAGDDAIYGYDGDDTISGLEGSDYLNGGSGDDVIFGGGGSDIIIGGSGDDQIDGGSGDDCIDGGSGDDYIDGGDGADHVHAGDDRDTIVADSGDNVDGGSGGDDYDTLVVKNVDHIQYTSADHEDGIVHFNDGTTMVFNDIENIVCFTPGTLISTAKGAVPVQDLKVGDKVITRDNGLQTIRWVGAKTMEGRHLLDNQHLRPILIRKGSLGRDLPERDMKVSPNHRMLVANERTSLLFEEREVLVAAKHLIDHKGIQQIDVVGTTYIHMLFDHHEVILADGAWSESFQPGDYSLKGMGNSQRNEIFEIFPELRDAKGRNGYGAARRSLKRSEARLLR